ncbi:hypothetical protein UK82_25450 [Frankia sp. ACN1ag]|nr:hypothetical protein UK82_25450 [Frankia sp. ACN1ag]
MERRSGDRPARQQQDTGVRGVHRDTDPGEQRTDQGGQSVRCRLRMRQDQQRPAAPLGTGTDQPGQQRGRDGATVDLEACRAGAQVNGEHPGWGHRQPPHCSGQSRLEEPAGGGGEGALEQPRQDRFRRLRRGRSLRPSGGIPRGL